MNIDDYLKVSKLVNNCPNCGSDQLGDELGTLSVKESIFERTCECGFNFKYDVTAGVKPKQIKQAIEKALSDEDKELFTKRDYLGHFPKIEEAE